jgi:hypothetical protein
MGKCLSTTIRKASDIAAELEHKRKLKYKKLIRPNSTGHVVGPDTPLDEEPPLLASKVAMYEDEEIDKIFE